MTPQYVWGPMFRKRLEIMTWLQWTLENSKNNKMLIIVSQQSVIRRYAAIVLSPFFIFAVFDVSLRR